MNPTNPTMHLYITDSPSMQMGWRANDGTRYDVVRRDGVYEFYQNGLRILEPTPDMLKLIDMRMAHDSLA